MDKRKQVELRSLPVSEQAAAWFLAFDDGEPAGETRRAFVAWLKEAPIHIEEFLQISALHQELAEAPEKLAAIETLVAEARTNLVDIAEPTNRTTPAPLASRRKALIGVAAGAAATLAAVVVFVALHNAAGPEEQAYQTDFGEQRSVVLDDDSMVVLNTESSVTITYTGIDRRAVLHTGEALFEVARDPDRPFTVDAGPLAIRVVGTKFNVYRQPQQTVLTVVEGEVSVATGDTALVEASIESPESSGTPLQVTAGQQLAVAATGAVAREQEANLERATAWTERRLVFDNEMLADVFDEFNRYNRRRVVLDVPQLAQRRITGVFDARDVDTLLGFVEGQPGVKVERNDDEIRVVASE